MFRVTLFNFLKNSGKNLILMQCGTKNVYAFGAEPKWSQYHIWRDKKVEPE